MSMQKVLIREFGDETKVEVVAAEITGPAVGQVQVRVEYSTFSGADVNMRRGVYPFQRKAPLTPGYTAVGTVERNGAGCRKFKPGEPVACLSIYDGQAELANLPERFLVPVPPGVDHKKAAALVLDWTTAYQMVVRAARVRAGQAVFVHGLSGAVGYALLQLAKRQGAKVYGTASAGNQAGLVKQGAHVFDYRDKKWIAAMQSLGGAHAVFDALGYESFDESYSILRRGGILVGYGMNLPALTGRPPRPILPAVLKLLAKNLLFWTGKRTTFYGIHRKSKTFAPDLRELFAMLQAGELDVQIRSVYPLARIQDAHREWGKGQGMGTMVIDVQGEHREQAQP